jgi:NAD(P)-dependent dehydrogenase (short-subunit alcohol dehydrogenase family)
LNGPGAARWGEFTADLFTLSGEVAIVTGGLGRLGSQYTATLARAGAAVAVFDKSSTIGPLVKSLIDGGLPVSVHQVDLTDRPRVCAATDQVAARFGTPTILVNNAGLGSSPDAAAAENGPFETYPESAWDAMLDSHLKTALFASQAFIAAFRRAGRRPSAGSIINISSTYGVVTPDQAVYAYRRAAGEEYYKPIGYAVAKSGVLNFTRWLAEYCAPLGIRVNTLVPGGVEEPGHPPAFIAEYVRRTLLGRMAHDGDYNGAVLFLAAPRASGYMTGATLVVDGGWTAR